MAAGVFNLCKAAVGVGILSLPYAMGNAGWALGLSLLLFGSLSTSSTLHFLSRIAANTDVGDYFSLGRMAFGQAGEIFAVVITLLYLMGGLIAYATYTSVYFSSFLCFATGVAKNSAWYVNSNVIIGISAALIFPLACVRDLSKLSKASVVGMACMGFVCVLTVVDYFIDTETVSKASYTAIKLSYPALQSFTLILFAFCNHFTMLTIVPTFIDPTPARRSKLLVISSSVVFVFYFLVSLFGYLHFGDDVRKNILLAPITTAPYAIAQLLVASVIILSFPLLCDPTKTCVEFLVSKAIGAPSAAGAHVRNFVITGSLVAFSALSAMTLADVILPILGAFTSLCGSMLMFIFPSLYFLRLSDKYRVSPAERAIAFANIGVGIVVLIFGTYLNVQEAIVDLIKLYKK